MLRITNKCFSFFRSDAYYDICMKWMFFSHFWFFTSQSLNSMMGIIRATCYIPKRTASLFCNKLWIHNSHSWERTWICASHKHAASNHNRNPHCWVFNTHMGPSRKNTEKEDCPKHFLMDVAGSIWEKMGKMQWVPYQQNSKQLTNIHLLSFYQLIQDMAKMKRLYLTIILSL